MQSTKTWKDNFTDFWSRRGKVQTLAELTAVQHMRAMSGELQRNSEAESSYVRKNVWGDGSLATNDVASNEVNDTILGDYQVNYPTPIIVQPPPSNPWLPMLLTAMVALAGGGIAGYFARSIPTPEPVEFDDETVELGLGRIEDFIKGTKDE
jgi:hypothetical protein